MNKLKGGAFFVRPSYSFLNRANSVHVYSGPEVGVRGRADIHPELTMDKIQNPPDARRSVLTSFGSRYINKSKMATFIQSNWLSCIDKRLT